MDFLKFILHIDTLHDRGILKFHNIFTKIITLAQNWSTFYIYIYIYIYIKCQQIGPYFIYIYIYIYIYKMLTNLCQRDDFCKNVVKF